MQKQLKITVDGRSYNVTVEDLTADAGSNLYPSPGGIMSVPTVAPVAPQSAARAPSAAPAAAGDKDKLAPLGGIISEICVTNGQSVQAGDKVAVIEAMKMKTSIFADHAGTVSNISTKVGDGVDAGQVLMTIS